MAQVAGRRGGDMVQRLPRRHDGLHRHHAMAFITHTLGHLGMINQAWQWRPGYRTRLVARVTHIGGGGVVRTLATGERAIMTTDACRADGLRMIHPIRRYREPGRGGFVVTQLTGIGGRYMVAALAAGIDAIMATDAVIQEARVIDHRRFPLRGTVAVATILLGGNMGGDLAGGDNAVVTTGAGAVHLGMIHRAVGHWRPWYGCRLVAGLAQVAGVNMIKILTTGYLTVVADTAGCGHLSVIDTIISHREPGRRKFVVAHLTLIAGGHMGWAFTAGDNGVVTTDAIIDDRCMIHSRWQPLGGAVARAAIVDRRYVVVVLATGDNAIVTTFTSATHLGVIHGAVRHRRPRQRAALVAGLAIVGSIDVTPRFA